MLSDGGLLVVCLAVGCLFGVCWLSVGCLLVVCWLSVWLLVVCLVFLANVTFGTKQAKLNKTGAKGNRSHAHEAGKVKPNWSKGQSITRPRQMFFFLIKGDRSKAA